MDFVNLEELNKYPIDLEYLCSICKLQTDNIYELEVHVRKHFKEKCFACLNCSSRFKVFSSLIDHINDEHSASNFKFGCRYCSWKTRTQNDLIEHEILHNNIEPFDCSNCGDTFKSNALLLWHKNFECGDRILVCNKCEKRFSQISDFFVHQRIHENLSTYQCRFCSRLFSKTKEFLIHIKSNHKRDLDKEQFTQIENALSENNFTSIENQDFLLQESNLIQAISDKNPNETIIEKYDLTRKHICPICSISFVQAKTLKVHCQRNHPNQSLSDETENANNIIQNDDRNNSNTQLDTVLQKDIQIIDKCFMCKREFKLVSELLAHIRNEHNGKKPYTCVICFLSFTRATTLLEHCTIHKCTLLKCNYCHELFDDRISQQNHLKLHEGKYVIKCPVCYIPYANNVLEEHGKIHSNVFTYSCHLCEKQFLNANEHYEHIELHEKMSIFKCSICDLTLKNRQELIDHIQMHKTKGFCNQCPICERTFNFKQNLITHIHQHINEKSHKCEICNKSFLTEDILQDHHLTHQFDNDKSIVCNQSKTTNLLLRKCNYCHKKFTRPSSLKDHLTVHTGDKPYKCKLCPKKYTRRTRIKHHLKVTHGLALDSDELREAVAQSSN